MDMPEPATATLLSFPQHGSKENDVPVRTITHEDVHKYIPQASFALCLEDNVCGDNVITQFSPQEFDICMQIAKGTVSIFDYPEVGEVYRKYFGMPITDIMDMRLKAESTKLRRTFDDLLRGVTKIAYTPTDESYTDLKAMCNGQRQFVPFQLFVTRGNIAMICFDGGFPFIEDKPVKHLREARMRIFPSSSVLMSATFPLSDKTFLPKHREIREVYISPGAMRWSSADEVLSICNDPEIITTLSPVEGPTGSSGPIGPAYAGPIGMTGPGGPVMPFISCGTDCINSNPETTIRCSCFRYMPYVPDNVIDYTMLAQLRYSSRDEIAFSKAILTYMAYTPIDLIPMDLCPHTHEEYIMASRIVEKSVFPKTSNLFSTCNGYRCDLYFGVVRID